MRLTTSTRFLVLLASVAGPFNLIGAFAKGPSAAKGPFAYPRTVIPEIASLLNVKVGFDTMAKLEKQLGRGLPITGGHPQGARIWHLKESDWFIHADGFDYPADNGRKHSYIIQKLTIYRQSLFGRRERGIPSISAPLRLLSPLGGRASLEMDRQDFLRIVRARWGPWQSQDGHRYVWKAKGYSRTSQSTIYQRWEIGFLFKKKHLMLISVGVE